MIRPFHLPENHAQRIKLHNEAHSRQPIKLRTPAQVSHLALVLDLEQKSLERRHLIALCDWFNQPHPHIDADQFSADFGGFMLRWQQHGEFSTYTFYQNDALTGPFADSPLNKLPENWLGDMHGKVMVAIHASIVKAAGEPNIDEIAASFTGNTLVGSQLADGAAYAFTDFQIYGDGFSRILLIDRHIHSRQAGRYLQRLFDIEDYRVMSLLAFPVARDLIPKLNRADQDLLQITTAMHRAESDDTELMDKLTALAAEIENCFAKTHSRFGAADAYHRLVERRIAELKEVRIQGVQPIGEFLQRRLEPAINTCNTSSLRLAMLSERISNAGQLLRTQVDITLERQNQALLASMNQRAHLQLHLQTTVEGLSVAAISYYTVVLIGYAAKALKALDIPLNPDLVIGASIPVVVLIVSLGIRNVRRMID
ncbi:MAG: DUF3422 family protein [Gammaproteobacteria bacterium]